MAAGCLVVISVGNLRFGATQTTVAVLAAAFVNFRIDSGIDAGCLRGHSCAFALDTDARQ